MDTGAFLFNIYKYETTYSKLTMYETYITNFNFISDFLPKSEIVYLLGY